MRTLLWLAIMLFGASAALAQAPTPADSAALEAFGGAGQHQELAEYVEDISPVRQLALAPLIAQHPNPDMRYVASWIYVQNDKVDEAIAAATDVVASSDLGEKHIMALSWAMIHGSPKAGTIEQVLNGVMDRLRGDLSGFTPDQQARLRKLMQRN